jgi:predicted O-linked N-acetylglucosamine transferase (SPINDLY family)
VVTQRRDTYAEAHALEKKGRLNDALRIYRSLLNHRPEDAALHRALARVYWRRGATGKALYHCRTGLQFDPHCIESHCMYGTFLSALGSPAKAREAFRRALQIDPNASQALLGAAKTSRQLHDTDTALSLLRKAVHVAPRCFAAQANYGLVLKDTHHYHQAQEALTAAVTLNPTWADGYNLLGIVAMHRNDHAQAATAFSRACTLDPDNAHAHNNLGRALFRSGFAAEACTAYEKALSCDPGFCAAHSNLLYARVQQPSYDAGMLYREHLRINDTYGITPARADTFPNGRDPVKPLRIGFLTPGFCEHPVGFFMAPVFEHISHSASGTFSLLCYADVQKPDTLTAYFRHRAHIWCDISDMRDTEVCTRIRDDAPDILIDLDGHSVNNRLAVFAHRAAPVQISYLAYPCTTGVRAMDYYLADTITDTDADTEVYSETLVRMPPPFFTYRPRTDAPGVASLPATRNGYVTFGSLHALSRLNDQVLAAWARILRHVPAARLMVFRTHLTDRFIHHLHGFFETRGIAPERIICRSRPDNDAHYLAMCSHIDIGLDTFPWSGHTTACELLWMGVPTLTLRGTRHAGRMVTSLLHCCGLDEWISVSVDDYIARAISWAGRLDDLSRLRATMRSRMQHSPVMQEQGHSFTRTFERTLRDIWRRFCAGER